MFLRYRPDVLFNFIVVELGFDSDKSCFEFLSKYNLHMYLNTDNLKFQTKDAFRQAESNRLAAFRKIDIKGQI